MYEHTILKTVNSRGPIKGVDLAIHVMSEVNPAIFHHDDYTRELEYLVKNGDIFELEYILSSMDYRVKTIYFPKGTAFVTNKMIESK